MKQEEINKAAEEARRETAIQARSDWHHSLDGVSLDVSIDELVESAFAGGAEWVLSQPLYKRLSDTEKEKIREIYWQAAKDWIGIGDARGHCKTCIALEFIFGADLFTDKTEL